MFQDKTELFKLQTRSRVITEAREWLGTPYQHQAMVKGVGADCVGLIVGVGVSTGVLTLTKKQMLEYAGYGRLPNPNKMQRVMGKHLTPVPESTVSYGDIAWLQWRDGLPMHLALISGHLGKRTLLHSTSEIGKVVEHSLTLEWETRIVSYWRYPGLV